MVWFLVSQLFSFILTLFRLHLTSETDKDLEILILRQQLGIVQRRQDKPIKPNRAEKLTLAVLSANLKKQSKRPTKQFRHIIRLFQPETVFGWHRQLVKRKWTHPKKNKVGRPPTKDETKALVVRLALENNWGYGKISGELEKLGIELLPGEHPIVPVMLHDAALAARFAEAVLEKARQAIRAGKLVRAELRINEDFLQDKRFLDEHLAVEPFPVSFGGLGAFPKPSRATVLWLAIERGAEQLAAMAGIAERAAQDAGFEPEDRPFHAHLTLARIRPPANVVPLIERVPRFPLSMEVNRLTLYRSHIGSSGATYEAIDTIEL